jgi:antitoxin (DNA-binding transcriptional repressor) of toxin-antitoxin stability system
VDVPIQTLRECLSEYVAHAERGQAFVIRRHSEPLAILRPLAVDDVGEGVPVSRFRANLPLWLSRARNRPLTLTWRGRRLAAIESLPQTGKRVVVRD